MNKPIDWNAVTVGETEIVDKLGTRRLVLVIHGNTVGTKIGSGDCVTQFYWWEKEDMADWTIYDPWEDVSHKCRFDDEFCVYHGNHMLIEDDIVTGRYKRDEAGLRVWQRKEGME